MGYIIISIFNSVKMLKKNYEHDPILKYSNTEKINIEEEKLNVKDSTKSQIEIQKTTPSNLNENNFAQKNIKKYMLDKSFGISNYSNYRKIYQDVKYLNIINWNDHLTNNSYSLHEHQLNRVTNIELMLKCSPCQWKIRNHQLENLIDKVTSDLDYKRAELNGFKESLRSTRTHILNKINRLEKNWFEPILKNVEIEEACKKVEIDINSHISYTKNLKKRKTS